MCKYIKQQLNSTLTPSFTGRRLGLGCPIGDELVEAVEMLKALSELSIINDPSAGVPSGSADDVDAPGMESSW